MKYRITIHNIIWIVSYFFVFIARFRNRKVQFFGDDLQNINAPVIFIANHKSPIDPWIIFSSLPFQVFLRVLPIRIFATTVILNHALMKFFSYTGVINLIYLIYGCINVRQSGTVHEKINPLLEVMEMGHSVLFFPEGNLVKGGEIGKIRHGTAVLLENSKDIPIVFCAVKYIRSNSGIGRVATVNFLLEEFDFSGDILETVHNKLSNLVKL